MVMILVLPKTRNKEEIMSTAVIQFLTERKEAYLKDKLKGHLSDEQQAVIHQEASDKFSLTTSDTLLEELINLKR